MVGGDNFSYGFFKTRPVLADVTNRPGKRAFSLISSDSQHKSGDGSRKLGADDRDSQFAKQVCLGVENLVKEKCQLQFGVDSHDKGKVLLRPKGKQPCPRLPFCGAVDSSLQSASSRNLLDGGGVQITSGNARDGCASGVSTPACWKTPTENCFGFGEKVHGRLTSGVSNARPLAEGFINHASENGDRDLCVDPLASSKCGAVERSTASASQDSKFLGLERCVGLKGDAGADSVVGGEDLLKACSCSFCSKAAYIWSDLHYQDVKGRLSALKKSQKEASLMVQKLSGAKDTVTQDQQNCTESSKLEMYLMDQWKSLFVHTENTFGHESSQLESSFETLKDLRENCKNGLELTDNDHFDSH